MVFVSNFLWIFCILTVGTELFYLFAKIMWGSSERMSLKEFYTVLMWRISLIYVTTTWCRCGLFHYFCLVSTSIQWAPLKKFFFSLLLGLLAKIKGKSFFSIQVLDSHMRLYSECQLQKLFPVCPAAQSLGLKHLNPFRSLRTYFAMIPNPIGQVVHTSSVCLLLFLETDFRVPLPCIRKETWETNSLRL